MIKLYGEIQDGIMRVDLISYSGSKPGGVEVGEVLEEGDGDLYIDIETKEQWRGEKRPEESLEQKLDKLLGLLEGSGTYGMGD